MKSRMYGHLKRNRSAVLWAVGLGLAMAGRVVLRRLRRMNLRDRVVLITGSSRGLGLLLASEFAHEGCRLVICARDMQELERARRELQRTEVEVLAVPCDLTDQGQVQNLVDSAMQRFGRVDILVNNAGIIHVGPLVTMTVQDFQEALKVMFWGMLHTTLAVLPQMVERKEGRIVNITSIGGKVSVPHLLPYNCAKFAAVGLSEGLRAELLKHGVRVVTIVPGLMRTGSYLNAFFKGRKEGEFGWFSLGATLPLISMSAVRAARQIVQAAQYGESERILSVPAKTLALFHGLFPGLTADLLGLVNRFVLPKAEMAETTKTRGLHLQERIRSSIFNVLTGLGKSAAERFHQYPGPADTEKAA